LSSINHRALKNQVWFPLTTSTTIAFGKLFKVMLLKVPKLKKIVLNALRILTSLNSFWSNNKFKMLTYILTKNLKSKRQHSFTIDLSSKKTKKWHTKSIFLYHSQELLCRWHTTLSGPLDSQWAKQVIYLLKSGLFKIKMKRELLHSQDKKQDDSKKNKPPLRNLIKNSLDKWRKIFSLD